MSFYNLFLGEKLVLEWLENLEGPLKLTQLHTEFHMELHEAMSHVDNPVLIFVKLMSPLLFKGYLVPPPQSLPYNVFVCS